jgi:DnaD/phage-associated family protein
LANPKPWLKMWGEWLDDPKMLKMNLAEQGVWWRLVSLSHRCNADGRLVHGSGQPLSLDEIADAIRCLEGRNRKTFDSMFEYMSSKNSIHWEDDTFIITNLKKRQEKVASETPEALRERQRRRRARMKEEYGIVDSSIPLENRLAVIERDKCKCQHCGKQGVRPFPEASVVIDPEDDTPFEFDHMVPRTRGGSHDVDNLLLSCRRCNRSRNARELSQEIRDNSDSNINTSPPHYPTPPPTEGERGRDSIVTNPLQTSKPSGILSEIVKFYEQNVGILTPVLIEDMKDFSENFTGQVSWVGPAFKEAASNNARRWSYVRAILERWQEEGGMSSAKERRGRESTRRTDTHRGGARRTQEPTEEEYLAGFGKRGK